MKKITIIMLGLIVVSMFLVGCSSETISNPELEAELEQLPDEELDNLIEQSESEENKALAGQATQMVRGYKPSKFLTSAYKVKYNKIKLDPCLNCESPECEETQCPTCPECEETECPIDTYSTSYFDVSGNYNSCNNECGVGNCVGAFKRVGTDKYHPQMYSCSTSFNTGEHLICICINS